MKVLRIILMALAFISFQAHAKDGRNLVVKESGGAGKRVALVIGNDHYGSVPVLRNAVADARSMAAALEKAGFDVTLKTDANLGAMKQAVRQFKARLSGGDEAIFFYSGHGVQLGAANYLLPVDITSDGEEQVKDDAIPLQRLLDDLQDQKVKFALAIIDACRDNPFKGSGRSIGGTRGLAPTSAANGQMVIFSAGAGQQALDKLGNTDREENGVFTRVFLQEMQKPGVEVHQVLRNVRSRVVQMAKSVNHDQMPALYDQVEGDFYFQPGSGTQIASLVPVPAPAGGGVSLDDIKKQQEARAQWDKWQAGMKADFDKIAALNAEPDLQVAAWDRFLSSYAQDNPYSAEDKTLRAQAQNKKQAAQAQQQQAAARLEQQKQEAERQRQRAERPQPAQTGGGEPAMVAIPGRNYEMGKYHVTQSEWKAVMGNNPSRFSNCGDNCPVENVSWNDVQEFISKLNSKTGKQYRLPNEAEWEYACHGGSQTEYCGGNDIDSVAWYGNSGRQRGNSEQTTHPVGQKQANGYGLYDMSGNVWNWMSNCYDNSCTMRVLRGGSWFNPSQHARADVRIRSEAAYRFEGNGFRLARTLP